ncbi:MAG: hypothetical protein KDK25_08765 [Leptospiraceae bacterium]|nr:hypothetical protein [Leptospiraceae bacterium]MCB1170411.1 hypothetical protein [Leptospiraceae bacterium]
MTLILALSIGFTVQTFLLARATLDSVHWKRMTALALIWCMVPAFLDMALQAFSPDGDAQGSPGDISGFALLSYFFVVPFYGFINGRLLQTINEESVLFLSLAALYLLQLQNLLTIPTVAPEFLSPGAAWFALPCVPLTAFLIRRRNPDSLAAPCLIYCFFLFLLILAAILQFDRIYVTLALPPGMQPSFFPLLTGSMLSIYLAFHLWFGAKFLMILLTCLRERGRDLAREFLSQKVRQPHLPWPAILLIASLQIALFAANMEFAFVDPHLMAEASILVFPQAMNYWLRGRALHRESV